MEYIDFAEVLVLLSHRHDKMEDKVTAIDRSASKLDLHIASLLVRY